MKIYYFISNYIYYKYFIYLNGICEQVFIIYLPFYNLKNKLLLMYNLEFSDFYFMSNLLIRKVHVIVYILDFVQYEYL